MGSHRFTVNIPNHTERTVVANLQLEPAKPSHLSQLPQLPRARLKVLSVAIATDPCEEGQSALRLPLRKFQSIDVYVTVVTADPADPTIGGTAAFHLTDRRSDRLGGGVLLVCVDPPPATSRGQVVEVAKACKVVVSGNLYAVSVGGDPSKPRWRTLPTGRTVDLVAPLTNPGRRRLTGVTAYLEHLAGSDAQFVPRAWSIGSMRVDDIFYAVWTVTAGDYLLGSFDASIVVQSAGTNPTRLRAPVRVVRKGSKKPEADG